MFPQSSCAFEPVAEAGNGTVGGVNGATYACGPVAPVRGAACQCSNCGTTCAGGSTLCPRCGSAMTSIS